MLFTLFLALPIGYTVYLSLRRTKVSGLGLGTGRAREVFVGLDNYAAALGRRRVLGRRGCGCSATARWCWS